MPAIITYSLGVTVVGLAALQVPFPVEMTALVMVGLVLRWFLRKDSVLDQQHEKRVAALEKAVAQNRKDIDLQRHRAHAALNRVAAVSGMVLLVKAQVERCTCGQMEAIVPLFDQIVASLNVDDLAYKEPGT